MSYRINNPRIIRQSNFDHFQFDIQVKASESNTYLWASQIKLNFNNVAFNNTHTTWQIIKAGAFNGLNSLGGLKYSVTRTITGESPNKVYNIALTGDPDAQWNGGNADDFAEIPTDWTTMITIRARLNSPVDHNQLTGISFLQGGMNGFQLHVSDPGVTQLYQTPNAYHETEPALVFLGRIFSAAHGWSQIGGGTNNVQHLDWDEALNTTVWNGDASITQADLTPAMANNLTILAGGNLTIEPGKWLTVNGTLSSPAASALVVADGGSLMHHTASVQATIQRSLTGGSINPTTHRYHLVSVPMHDASVFTAGDLFTGLHLWEMDHQNQEWSKITSSNHPINNKEGYLVWFNGASYNYQVGGWLNSGEVNFPAIQMGIAGGNSFRLLPNPYPSAVDWEQVTKTGYDDAIYFFNSETGNYVASVDGIPNPAIIPIGQAFFIKKSSAGGTGAGIQLNNASRLHHGQGFYKSVNSPANLLKIKALSTDAYDETYIRFVQTATAFFDGNLDALKLKGFGNAPQLFTVLNGVDYAINALPAVNEIFMLPMHFEMAVDGQVTLDASMLESFDEDVSVFLEDLHTNQMINLHEQHTYTFDHVAGNAPNRFMLHFTNVLGQNEKENQTHNIWAHNKQLYINLPDHLGQKAFVEIIDLAGRIVYKSEQTLNSPTVVSVDLPTQLFVVKVTTGTRSATAKIVL
ncbi:MAG: T9SS type A sorting domain-containing protein [Bacteroidetes bacterium]|nr:T9SS type A sorting domain-containing protein [Bacteroidota bacterium]